MSIDWKPHRVLLISHDVVDTQMAGPGIRYLELARVLSQCFPVTLAVPSDSGLPAEAFEVWPYRRDSWESIAAAVSQADVVLACGDSLADFPALGSLRVPLAIDGYDPHTLETLALWAAEPLQRQRTRHRDRSAILHRQCQAGDFFLCASERQRDWWLGILESEGRINPLTYGRDPSLRSLVDVVPYGLPTEPPSARGPVLRGVWPGVGPRERILLWGGGLWEWLDPLTAVRAVDRLVKDGEPIRLVFPGTRHPNPHVPEMPLRARTVAFAEALGLAGDYVLFGDWIPYADWPGVLLEADVGLSLHPDTIEARLAYRSRVLDYIWAGLPMVVSQGDAISEVVDDYGLGLVVGYGDDAALAEAIRTLLAQPRSDWADRFAQARSQMTWERVAQPLVEFCRDPRRAADRFAAEQRSELRVTPVPHKPPLDQSERYRRKLQCQVEALEWYHTIDLGEGIVTPGIYDHRPYLEHYGIPQALTAKTVLDVGAASGFFSFEMERRGARVTAIDLPTWGDHDFGPDYKPDMAPDDAQRYLHEPFLLARQALGSRAEKLEMTVYDITPESVGVHDLVFCGSLLIHVTDPIRALWNIQSVTGDQAIIATSIHVGASHEPQAQFVGHQRGDGWWIPNRACLEAWVQAAGFADWEWVSEFRLDYRDGRPGPYHGVIRAWNRPSDRRGGVTPSGAAIGSTPSLSGRTDPRAEIERLRELVAAYEEGRFMRLMRWIHQWRERIGLS